MLTLWKRLFLSRSPKFGHIKCIHVLCAFHSKTECETHQMKRKVRLLIKISFNTTAIEMAKVSRAPSPGNPYAFLFRNQRAGVVQTKYLALRCVLFYLFLSNEPIVLLPKENIGITVCSPLNLSSRWRSCLFASLQDDTPKHKQHSYFNHGKFYHWMNAYENVIENNHFRMLVSGKYMKFSCYHRHKTNN